MLAVYFARLSAPRAHQRGLSSADRRLSGWTGYNGETKAEAEAETRGYWMETERQTGRLRVRSLRHLQRTCMCERSIRMGLVSFIEDHHNALMMRKASEQAHSSFSLMIHSQVPLRLGQDGWRRPSEWMAQLVPTAAIAGYESTCSGWVARQTMGAWRFGRQAGRWRGSKHGSQMQQSASLSASLVGLFAGG